MSEELKPCPFCGKADKLVMHHRKVYYYDNPLSAIMCKRCGIRGRYQLNEEGATRAWNARPERTCHIVTRDVDGVETDFYYACGSELACYYLPRYCPNCGAKVVE